MNEKFSTRLSRALTLKNIKPIELSEKTGINKSGISQYLNDFCIPKDKNKEKIANALNINKDWLMGYDVPMEKSNLVTINIYSKIPAKIPMEKIKDIIDTEDINPNLLIKGQQYFGLYVEGDSMEPEYLDGDILILKKTSKYESEDDCVVMINGNDGIFKRVLKNSDGIILQPLNNKYEKISYTNAQISSLPITIIGVVVELRRRKKSKKI